MTAYVQGNIHQNGSTSSATCAVTLTSTVASGNMLCVSLGWVTSTGVDIITVTDDKGNTYTVVDKTFNNPASYSLCDAYCLNITNAPQTITATISTARQFSTIFVDEWSGIATSSALDGHAINQLNGASGTDIATSTAITTTANGDLIYGVCICINSVGISAGTGFTQRQNVASTFLTESLIQGSAGSIAATATPASAGNLNTAVMAFKAAAAAEYPLRRRVRNLYFR
jgi:hypothetical protein